MSFFVCKKFVETKANEIHKFAVFAILIFKAFLYYSKETCEQTTFPIRVNKPSRLTLVLMFLNIEKKKKKKKITV